MVGLWAYAAGIGATNKYNQIKDEQRALAGTKELEEYKNKLNPPDDDNDLASNLFSLKGTDVSFGLPSREEMLRLPDSAAKRSAVSNRFLNGMLEYDEDTWNSIVNSSDATVQGEYNRMEREFLQHMKNYWKYEGTTDDQSPIYKSFDYEALKEVLPNLYDKLSKIDPLHDPDQEYNPDFETDWNIKEGVKFGANSSMEDVINIPYEFGNSSKANIEGFNNHYGIEFGKETLMSGQYGSWSSQQYENAKANAPWTILIPTYMAMMDDNKLSIHEGSRSIVEMQLAHGLSDKELISAMSAGVKKYELGDHGGGRFVRRKIGKVPTKEKARAANSAAASFEIVKQIDMMQRWVQDSTNTEVGLAGWVRKFWKGAIEDETSQLNRMKRMLSAARDSSDEIIWAGTTFEERNENKRKVIERLEHGVSKMESMWSNHNQGHINLWDVEKDSIFEGETVTQSMISTLAIGLAFQIALTEQGSGGKAVSDQDFENAITRIQGDWFGSKSEMISSLNVEKHKFAQRAMKESILMGEYESHGMNLLLDYQHIIGEREKYLLELKKDFRTVGAIEFASRTQRLIDMYTTVGGSQDGVLFPGGDEVVMKTKEQQFGERPDVLRGPEFAAIFDQMTEKEKNSVMIRLGNKDNLDEINENNKKNGKTKTIIETFKDYDKISKGYNVPTPVKGSNPVDFAQRLLNENRSLLVKDAIDISIARYQKDNLPMFKEDIHIAIEKEEELRTFILKNWLMKYYKKESDIFQRAMGEIGVVSNPENEDALSNIYSSLWGAE